MKYCVIKHLILLKTRNMMDIKGVLLQWFESFLRKKIQMEQLKMEIKI